MSLARPAADFYDLSGQWGLKHLHRVLPLPSGSEGADLPRLVRAASLPKPLGLSRVSCLSVLAPALACGVTAALRSLWCLQGLGCLQGVPGGRTKACHSKQRRWYVQMAGQLLSVYVVGKSFLFSFPKHAAKKERFAWLSCRHVGFSNGFFFHFSIVLFFSTPPKPS